MIRQVFNVLCHPQVGRETAPHALTAQLHQVKSLPCPGAPNSPKKIMFIYFGPQSRHCFYTWSPRDLGNSDQDRCQQDRQDRNRSLAGWREGHSSKAAGWVMNNRLPRAEIPAPPSPNAALPKSPDSTGFRQPSLQACVPVRTEAFAVQEEPERTPGWDFVPFRARVWESMQYVAPKLA